MPSSAIRITATVHDDGEADKGWSAEEDFGRRFERFHVFNTSNYQLEGLFTDEFADQDAINAGGVDFIVPPKSAAEVFRRGSNARRKLVLRLDDSAPSSAEIPVIADVSENEVTIAALAETTTALLAANDLSDLADVATARTNLGLGTAATQSTGTFAQIANDLSDLADAATARTNLGLGAAATAAIDEVGPAIDSLVAVHLGSDQVLPNGSEAVIEFATEVEDAGNEWSITNHDFTATEAGLYEVNAQLRWSGANTNCTPHIYVDDGGGFDKVATGTAPGADGPGGSSISQVLNLSAGHKVEIRAENTGSAGATFTGSTGGPPLVQQNFLTIKRLK